MDYFIIDDVEDLTPLTEKEREEMYRWFDEEIAKKIYEVIKDLS